MLRFFLRLGIFGLFLLSALDSSLLVRRPLIAVAVVLSTLSLMVVGQFEFQEQLFQEQLTPKVFANCSPGFGA